MLTYVLIGINVAITWWAFRSFQKGDRPQRFLFYPYHVARGRNFIGILLSQFSHADFPHVFFNMLTFFFFGPVVERHLGYNLLTIYLGSGLAALLLIFLLRRNNPDYKVLGASGCVTGVMFAAIVLEPQMHLSFILLPIPIPAPFFALIYLAITSWLLKDEMGNVSHEAHLAGGVTGLILAGLLSPSGFAPLADRFQQLIH